MEDEDLEEMKYLRGFYYKIIFNYLKVFINYFVF
jgi:hypothetical protein